MLTVPSDCFPSVFFEPLHYFLLNFRVYIAYYISLTGSDIMAFQIVSTPMTLSELQVHAPNTGFLKCEFSYSYAAVDKISTDSASRGLSAITTSFWGHFNAQWRKPRAFATISVFREPVGVRRQQLTVIQLKIHQSQPKVYTLF